MRDYIDALDGSIYRERSHSHAAGQIPNPDHLGYAVDGVCDGIGDFFRFIAFVVLLQRFFSAGNRLKKIKGLYKGTELQYLLFITCN